MDLREGEQILKVFRRHPTPFVFDMIKAILAIIPFYIMLFLFQNALPGVWYFWIHVILFLGFVIVITLVAVDYWLDKLVVTNMRVVFINWINIFHRHEAEALLDDIQDIQTEEKGFLANLWVFDYGLFQLETAASHLTINFDRSPDPEGIRRFIYHLRPPVV